MANPIGITITAGPGKTTISNPKASTLNPKIVRTSLSAAVNAALRELLFVTFVN